MYVYLPYTHTQRYDVTDVVHIPLCAHFPSARSGINRLTERVRGTFAGKTSLFLSSLKRKKPYKKIIGRVRAHAETESVGVRSRSSCARTRARDSTSAPDERIVRTRRPSRTRVPAYVYIGTLYHACTVLTLQHSCAEIETQIHRRHYARRSYCSNSDRTEAREHCIRYRRVSRPEKPKKQRVRVSPLPSFFFFHFLRSPSCSLRTIS